MSSLATIELDSPSAPPPGDDPDYIPLIVRAMEAQDMGIRQMALRTNIKKSRLGVILHRDSAKRAPMTLPEFQSILRSLNIDLMQAIISVEMARDLELMGDERFATLVAMLSTLFNGLPHRLIEALRELEGMDGSEIRKEWGTYFQSAVIKKMVAEISRILQRRAVLEEGNDFAL
ncbi:MULTISPECIES: XRE family transcriptional regulator [Sphingomonadaceae]|nr:MULTISPECIES: XRE family transcriptional regulator [Sphingomonadaceae]MBZ6382937.1 XRE family transcriptional regulator [Sphingomonas sanguinis]